MKLSTIKYPSGREVSLTAFLLTMTSVDVGAARRLSINRKDPGFRTPGPRRRTTKRMRIMNADHFKSKWNHFKGQRK